jgi:hypothetical protein
MYVCPTKEDDDDTKTATTTKAFTSNHEYEEKVIAH